MVRIHAFYFSGTGNTAWVVSRLAEPLEALAFQGFYADESCTRCGWCVSHCPVQNIAMTQRGLQFLDRCMLCMRCYSFCPQQAIQCTERTKDVSRFPRYPGPEGRPYPGQAEQGADSGWDLVPTPGP